MAPMCPGAQPWHFCADHELRLSSSQRSALRCRGEKVGRRNACASGSKFVRSRPTGPLLSSLLLLFAHPLVGAHSRGNACGAAAPPATQLQRFHFWGARAAAGCHHCGTCPVTSPEDSLPHFTVHRPREITPKQAAPHGGSSHQLLLVVHSCLISVQVGDMCAAGADWFAQLVVTELRYVGVCGWHQLCDGWTVLWG